MKLHYKATSIQVKPSITKIYSLEERIAYKKAKDPQYAWAAKKSIQHKHSAGLKLFLQTIIACSNIKGICEVGIDAQIKKHLQLHGIEISIRTAGNYVATLKKQRLITKYEIKSKYSSRTIQRGKLPGQIRWNTYATRLAWVSTAKSADIIYPPKDIYREVEKLEVGKAAPGVKAIEKAHEPLGAAQVFQQSEKKIVASEYFADLIKDLKQRKQANARR